MANFINLADVEKKDLRRIIDRAKKQKKNTKVKGTHFPLKGKTLIMVLAGINILMDSHLMVIILLLYLR